MRYINDHPEKCYARALILQLNIAAQIQLQFSYLALEFHLRLWSTTDIDLSFDESTLTAAVDRGGDG
jgi:hypothetical protein